MRTTSFPRIGPLSAAAALAAAVALGPGGAGDAPARASSPAAPPGFSAPLDVTNPYLPFVPGAVKVFSGREGRSAVTIVVRHLSETRTFEWGGGAVPCRVVEELKFVGGAAASRETFFLAQADDGSVWTFGEVEDDDPTDDGGDDAGEPGGWIVGQAAPGDPPDLIAGAAPAMVMPADPQRGDEWKPEDHPPLLLKSSRAESTRAVVRAAGVRLSGCLRVVEADLVDEESEVRTYAPGLGLVSAREPGERVLLRASTLRRGR